VVEVKSNERGGVDLNSLREVVSRDVAALMLTNPNTLGLFDENVVEIAKIVHDAGGLLYYGRRQHERNSGHSAPWGHGF